MGSASTAPVNEAAFFFERAAPGSLERLRDELPEIAADLQQGVWAGEDEQGDNAEALARQGKILLLKARFMVASLREAQSMCDEALSAAARKIKRGRRTRLVGQVTTVIGSSGVLGALGATQTALAALSGVLALTGALTALAAEHFEQVADAANGSLNVIYLDLADYRYRASALADVLHVHVEENVSGATVEKLISEGNELCRQINKSAFQVIEQLINTNKKQTTQNSLVFQSTQA